MHYRAVRALKGISPTTSLTSSMSWFSGPNVIETATSENIPNGEQNIALNLDICDMVRSKKLMPQDALKQLKPRLMHINPNIQILALHLLDLLVKNGGHHFLEKFASEDFLNAFTGQIRSQHIQGRSPEVVQLMLEYLQQWAYMTKDQPILREIWNTYQRLKPNYEFPPLQETGSSYVEAEVAPEWVDSDSCMKSGQPFTFYNRKHHCRNCGGVYLQEYCKDFVPLPKYGITEPVRVCVDCKTKLESRTTNSRTGKSKNVRGVASNNSALETAFDRDLRQALEASMAQEGSSSSAVIAPAGIEEEEEMDEDMKAAIAASLADMKNVASAHHHHRQEYVQEQMPMPRSIDQGLVTPQDFERVESLKQLLLHATPQDAIYDQRITDGERHAVSMQPKVVKDLTDAADKLQTLEDLHSRILSISTYYDKFLDAELQRASGQKPATIPSQSKVPLRSQAPQQPSRVQPARAPQVPSYAPSYSQPLSHQGTGSLTPFAPPSVIDLPSVPSAPIKDSGSELEHEPQAEKEEEAMLIEL